MMTPGVKGEEALRPNSEALETHLGSAVRNGPRPLMMSGDLRSAGKQRGEALAEAEAGMCKLELDRA
jgi:hypothetical protein